MQAHDTEAANKAALYTSLKCGIPVAVLAGFVMFCLYMPDEFQRALGSVGMSVIDCAWLALIGLGSVLRALSNAIYPILAVIVGGYLWSACALNNLKGKGLTGRLYEKLTRAFIFFTYASMASMALWFFILMDQLSQRPPTESMIPLWTWMCVGGSLFFLFMHTSTKNADSQNGDSDNEQ